MLPSWVQCRHMRGVMLGLSDRELVDIFDKHIPMIDVRAPVEFTYSQIPQAVNLPILDDEQRRLVGTCYKQQGSEDAIKLAHDLVSGQDKQQKISAWMSFFSHHPEGRIFCFRGGQRSQIACQWIREAGHEIYPLAGGQKRIRSFLLEVLEMAQLAPLMRIAGPTGSGKTKLLAELAHTYSVIDLEALANHRGSAFGDNGVRPSQASFENALAVQLLRLRRSSKIFVEDEARAIGSVGQPTKFFQALQSSPIIWLEEDLEKRCEHIFNEYVGKNFFGEVAKLKFANGVEKIKKKLGETKAKEIRFLIDAAFDNPVLDQEGHLLWIRRLLVDYYDPLYLRFKSKYAERLLFSGNYGQVLAHINSQDNFRSSVQEKSDVTI